VCGIISTVLSHKDDSQMMESPLLLRQKIGKQKANNDSDVTYFGSNTHQVLLKRTQRVIDESKLVRFVYSGTKYKENMKDKPEQTYA